MSEKQDNIEKEAQKLYGCTKPIFNYMIESAGSIGSSKKDSAHDSNRK